MHSKMIGMKLFVTIFIGLVMSIEAEKNGETATPTPSPESMDCSTVMHDMLDCIPYLSSGSPVGKVELSCCSGLESVLSVDSSCLCVGLKESVTLGINLNLTRALHLPSDCNLSVSPSVTRCSVSSSPSSSSPPPSHPQLSPKPSSPPSHPQLSPKPSPTHVAPSISKAPPVSAPKSSSSSPASSASPKKAPIIISQTTVPAPAPTKSSGSSSISIISIINLVLVLITMVIN